MAKRYLTKDAWHFQYALDDESPRYTALVYQGALESVSPWEEEDGELIGVVKTIFPGGTTYDYTEIDPGIALVDFLLLENGDALLLENGDNLILG